MANLNVSLIFRAVDRASAVVRRVNSALQLNQAQVRGLAAAHRHGALALGAVTSGVGALAAAAGAGVGTRYLGNLEERIVRLGIQANRTDGEIIRLKDDIFALAQNPDIRVNPDELIAAVEQIVEKTGDLDLARDNIQTIALAMQAAGAAGQDAGAMVADMMEKFGLRDPKEFLDTLDLLVRQGKEGSFTLRNLAALGNRVTAAYANTGRTGAVAAREMGAILQMVRRTTGSAEEAATAFERMLSTITIDKIDELQKRGIQLFDPEKLKEGVKEFRSIPDVIKEIIRATGGDAQKLGQVFDIRSMRALSAFAIEFRRTGGFESFDRFLAMHGDGAELMRDSARAAGTFNAGLQNLGTTIKRLTDDRLTSWLQRLNAVLNAVSTSRAAGTLFDVAIGLAGLAIAARVVRPIWSLVMAAKGLVVFSGIPGLIGGFILALRAGYPVVQAFNLALRANPIGAVITALTLLASAAWMIYENWQPISTWFTGLWDGFKKTVARGVLWILERVASLGKVLPGAARRVLGLDAIDDEIEKRRRELRPQGAAITPAAGAAAAAGRDSEFKGQLHIRIDSDGRPQVRALRSDNRNIGLDVDAGLVMGTP